MEAEFKNGDIVYHKSNPDVLMVITWYDSDYTTVSCTWITKKGKIKIWKFHKWELTKKD